MQTTQQHRIYHSALGHTCKQSHGLPWKTVTFHLLREARPASTLNNITTKHVCNRQSSTERGSQRTVLSDQAELPGVLALQCALQVHCDVRLTLLLQAVLRAWKIKGAGGGEEV